MMKKNIALVLAAVCLGGAFIGTAFAESPPSGSYQSSCGNITWNGTNLSAQCFTDMHDAPMYMTTMIINTNYQTLQNAQPWNGHGNLLAAGITPGGTWYTSCYGSVYDVALHLLHSSCKGPDGIPYPAAIQASASDNVENINGTLVKE